MGKVILMFYVFICNGLEKQKVMQKITFCFVINLFCLIVSAQNAVPFVGKKALWGFKVGEQITIPCRYTEVAPFSEGLARVTQIKKGYKGQELVRYGYVNTQGIEVIPCIYTSAANFNDGLASVQLEYTTEHGYAYAFIDQTGKIAFYQDTPGVGLLSDFSEGFAIFNKIGDPNHFGYADKKGRVALPAVLTQAGPFKNGIAQVKDANGKACSIDTNFFRVGTKSFIMPITWQKADNGKYTLTNGVTTLAPAVYDAVEWYEDGYSAVKQNGKWGVLNSKGREVLGPVCSAIYPPSKNSKVLVQEDFIIVKANGKMSLVSATRNVESPPCDEVQPMYNGLAMVTLDKTKGWQYVNRDMQPIDLSSGISLYPLYAGRSEPTVFESAYAALKGVGLKLVNDVLIIPYYEKIEYSYPVIRCIKGNDTVSVLPDKLSPENSDFIEISELQDVPCQECNGSGRLYFSSVKKGEQTATTTYNKSTSSETRLNTKTGQYDGYTKTQYTPVTTYSQSPDKVIYDSEKCPHCNGSGYVKGKENKHLVWDTIYHRYRKQ